MATPYWIVQILKRLFPYRKPVAKLSRIPGAASLLSHVFAPEDHLVYVPKDRVVIQASINEQEDYVLPSSLVDHFIEHASYHWIMDRCICRDGDNCQKYPHDIGCIFLGEAVTKINPKFGHIVTKQQALDHARRARELGLIHLIGRDRIDSIWMGVGPSDKLMTICNCCPCCCLFRILPDLSHQLSRRITRMPGVEVHLDGALCIGCELCTRDVCFVDAITMSDGIARINEDECRGCGRCMEVCPSNAIHLSIYDQGYVSNSINRLSQIVDVNGKLPHGDGIDLSM